MHITRRTFLEALGTGTAAATALQLPLAGSARAATPARSEFIERLAALHRVSERQVLVGCGSVEILRVAAQAFTGPGKKLIMASPTFEVIGQFAEAVGAEVVRVRLTGDFAHDLPAMLTASGGGAGLVYICNPNNPTASLTPRKELDAFIG